MPGVVFVIVVPTANFERDFLNSCSDSHNAGYITAESNTMGTTNSNNLNINLPEHNAVLRLEVELRDKHARRPRQKPGYMANRDAGGAFGSPHNLSTATAAHVQNLNNYFVPLEKVLEELLLKLEIEHVTWSNDKKGYYRTVIFPLESGDPCETTLHCLTQLGIGTKPGSNVSVLPCSVTYDAIRDEQYEEDNSDSEAYTKWNSFVDSIKSKLTVKQVVDGVRAGGAVSFDYLLLIITADSLAALGLIENNAPNITAAMLVSPLMGPVMSITFGAMISDRDLMKSGFIALATGMFISILFGFVFGLIVGTTEMPWGFNDWPTEEMKGRGNARSLWMAVAWALTSGSGVALALLQGAAGPLIGVAISASLLPPMVNCGLYWALACIWLIYDGIKMPHIKGEPFTGNSSYVPVYTNYVPTEFFISGIVSGLLTVINVICIFITAIIVLKIKEVAAPYTSSPDLRRFWETDIRAVRRTNKSTIRRKNSEGTEKHSAYDNVILNDPKGKNLESALGQALKEAVDDDTYRMVKRMSYSGNAAGELSQKLGISAIGSGVGNIAGSANLSGNQANLTTLQSSKLNADLGALDVLVTSLLERHNNQQQGQPTKSLSRGNSTLNRLKSFSFRHRRSSKVSNTGTQNGMRDDTNDDGCSSGGSGPSSFSQAMPTIMETNGNSMAMGGIPSAAAATATTAMSTMSDRPNNVPTGVRQIINTITNAPHRFSHSSGARDEENTNLTENMLD